ncbi:MAG: hypothetical protein P0Y53_00840 [Candidatus Pseudobacter hemicellulosilyticus]|uniref:Uncharacterized protein n=1 Tax=Candidatus Pseudobacter hemicellulosilyticus TaxID=3121375 RepID=A0AAJ5WUT1_9BACT|nr:MAG: hypothetical protein P0Y53_00840 [Pseudobacter sp.]
MKKVIGRISCFLLLSVGLFACKRTIEVPADATADEGGGMTAFLTLGGGGITEADLNGYLSRAITCTEYLSSTGYYNDGAYNNKADDTRLIKSTGAKFIGRAIYSWGFEDHFQDPTWLANAKVLMDALHAFNADIIFQAAIFEIVTTKVNAIPVPAWVFSAFGLTPTTRNFVYTDMLNTSGAYVNHWGSGASVPDISRLEARMFFYYMAKLYMDAGIEALHFGQVELMAMTDAGNNYAGWSDLLSRVRSYAASNARRGAVLCDGHMWGGGVKVGSQLLFDFVSFPLRIRENAGTPQTADLAIFYKDAIYTKTNGGTTPSGWTVAKSPYLVEFDNYGISGSPGVATGTDHWVWGYDEISWYYLQPEPYRNSWLQYAYSWLATNDPNGHLQTPVRRWATHAGGIRNIYNANTNSVACPTGMNQEGTINQLWNNYVLNGLAQVNAFAPSSSIIGNLTITGSDVTDHAVSFIKTKISEIRGTLTIENCPLLTTTENFIESVVCKGSIVFRNNAELFNPNAFMGYTRINGDLVIENCPKMYYWTGGQGFSNITRVEGNLRIDPATRFGDAGMGLGSLSFVGGDFVLNGDRANSLGSIWNLDSWYVLGNALTHIGGNLVYNNHYRVNGLSGFQGLTYIGGDVQILDNGVPDGQIPVNSVPGQVGFCLFKEHLNNGVFKKASPVIQLRQSPGDPLINISTVLPCY